MFFFYNIQIIRLSDLQLFKRKLPVELIIDPLGFHCFLRFFPHRWRFGNRIFKQSAIFLQSYLSYFPEYSRSSILLRTKTCITVSKEILILICPRRSIYYDTWASSVPKLSRGFSLIALTKTNEASEPSVGSQKQLILSCLDSVIADIRNNSCAPAGDLHSFRG